MPRAALFDLDRTLVRRETAGLWMKYQHDHGEVGWLDRLRVARWVLEYTLGVIDAPRVAEKALAGFAGLDEAELAERCQHWFRAYVLEHVCERGRDAVERHRSQGDVLAIVTGTSPYAARPLAEELGIPHVVASVLEVRDGKLTGKAEHPLCYAQGKLERARGLATELGFALADATFYTDSFTDLPLLEAVGTPIAVNPDRKLRRIATERGWLVEAW